MYISECKGRGYGMMKKYKAKGGGYGINNKCACGEFFLIVCFNFQPPTCTNHHQTF